MKRGPKPSKKSFVIPVIFRVNKYQLGRLKFQAWRFEPKGGFADHIRACVFKSRFKRSKNEVPTKKEKRRWNYTERIVFKVTQAQSIRLSKLAQKHTAGDISKYIRWCLFEMGSRVFKKDASDN